MPSGHVGCRCMASFVFWVGVAGNIELDASAWHLLAVLDMFLILGRTSRGIHRRPGNGRALLGVYGI